jgi:hypothetical protein
LDNEGEHQTNLRNTCAEVGVTLEYTAPSTSQLIGVIKGVLLLTEPEQMLWWRQHLSSNGSNKDFGLKQSKLQQRLVILLATQTKLLPMNCFMELFLNSLQHTWLSLHDLDMLPTIRKFEERRKLSEDLVLWLVMLNHNHDTYRMFDSSTKEVILSRDVKWAEWKRSDPASSLQLILHECIPLRNGEDKNGTGNEIGQAMDAMDIIPFQMTGNPYYDKVDSGHVLITDDKESGSGRIGALPYDSDDEDNNSNGLWGLPPALFPETPPRVPGTPPQVPGLLTK